MRRTPAALGAAVAVLGAGVVAGMVGILMVLALHGVEWLAFGAGADSLVEAMGNAPAWRRILAVPLGAGLAGIGWWALRRRRPVAGIADALGDPEADFPVGRTTADAMLQVLVVGSGTSVGRESAPRQTVAAASNALCRRLGLRWELRRTVVAAGAGAGLAAVYNTPWAAIPFALTVTLGQWSIRGAILVGIVSWTGTSIAWLVTEGRAATPLVAVDPDHAMPIFLWASIAIPACAFVGTALERLSKACRRRGARVPPNWKMPLAMAGAGLLTGCVGFVLPQVLGNGKSSFDELFGNVQPLRPLTVALCLGVFAAKPILTSLAFRTGVVGGMLMPSASTGAAMGGAVAIALGMDWQVVAAFALIGGVAVLSVTQASPAFAVVFGLELTRCPMWLWPAVAAAAFGAYWSVRLARRLRDIR